MRRLDLAGTELARAQAGAIRLKLLKIGAVVLRNTRQVGFSLAVIRVFTPLSFHIGKALVYLA
ncbi:MAG TPA: transposase [Verrucomicrobiae bacterium]|nr:transposase [Verrucomicrobiae bacterium]